MSVLRLVTTLALFVGLCGCAGFGRGVTEAVLESGRAEDRRLCHVEGPAVVGLERYLLEQERERAAGGSNRTMKILMVHGIGKHLPGYSARLQEHLMRELGLDVREARHKEIRLRMPEVTEGPLGILRIHRYTNKARTREALFYELTWSKIVEPEKQTIEFDDSGEHTFRRASLNRTMKAFFNSHIPYSLIYLGTARLAIMASVHQSNCWMSRGRWADYAERSDAVCRSKLEARPDVVREDDYIIVTHSLGSRIVIDTLQFTAQLLSEEPSARQEDLKASYRDKTLPIIMLANQLPLLELGREPAAVRGKIPNYCRPDGDLYAQRFVGSVPIFAFSDPNDLLSYSIPPRFADEYLDSRICPRVVNVSINVANPVSLMGVTEFANPKEAHVAYDNDERVIALIANGIGHDGQSELIRDRCTWLQTIEE